MSLEPELTAEQKAELDALASEAIIATTLARIVDEVCPMTPIGRRRFDRVQMSDRSYMVWKDGSLRRLPKQP
jgi:hypothetical protein